MISFGAVLLLITLGVSNGGMVDRVDRVLENLLIQNSNLGAPESGAYFDKESFLDHGRQFKDFVNDYEKEYETDTEIEKRFNIFRSNLREIDRLNEQDFGTATFGVNKFADLTAVEFNYGLSPINLEDLEKMSFESYESNETYGYKAEKSLDYRQKGVILEKIQDQHMCGSCWAHAAAANIEAAYAQKTKNLVELSKSQIIDCDYEDDGCCGGWPFLAYDYVRSAGGLMAEKDYKQRIYEGPCKFDKNKVLAKIGKSYIIYSRDDPIFNEYRFERYMNDVGPLVAIINANGFRFYKSGVLNQPNIVCSKSTRSLNHAVLNVGYGVETVGNEKYPYWILRNSWGKKWGENGYIRIAKGVNSCGLGWIASGVVAQ